MKKSMFWLTVFGAVISDGAHAQSSVTLYGIIDVGLNYISNDNGKANWTLTSGVSRGSRWGFVGTEDLGGGLKAVFQLENGFSLTNGSLGQGGLEFGRQAWVGLSSDVAGTIRLGRQYDSLFDFVSPLAGFVVYGGFAHPFDNDNLLGSVRINNSIKYLSADYRGFKFGGLYGFSNSANTDTGAGFSYNRVWSVGAAYSHGPVSAGAGYLHMNSPGSNTIGAITAYPNLTETSPLQSSGLASAVVREDVWTAAATYKFSALTTGILYSHSSFSSVANNLKFDNFEVNAGYRVTPFLQLAGVYSFTDGKLASTAARPRYHQLLLTGDYSLSKRTDMYLTTMYQRAVGDATTASIAPDTFGAGGSFAPDASTTQNQLLVRLGMLHKF
ncbi:porin [Paraburkholderia sediminicola]|uniref:porin n=1 Tax=Paraburkholderia sediminicola TaxID=458836 RepID=UPI0038BD5338